MANKMLVTMKMDQRLQMSQQLRQAITLLQYNTLDLKQLVQQHIDTNPLLEVEEESESDPIPEQNYLTKQVSRKQHFTDDSMLENFSKPKSLREHLLDQTLLCQFNETEQTLAEAIIDAIDEQGFLSIPLSEIHELISKTVPVTFEIAQYVLCIIQTFEPAGVASRDMRECLLIQLKSFYEQGDDYQLAYKIIQDFYAEFCANDMKTIQKNLRVTQEQLMSANHIISHLNLHPGMEYTNENDIYIEPELYVKKIKNNWHVMLADSILTEIKINRRYQNIIRQSKQHASYQSLKKELEEAKALLTGLKRRNETLLAVATHIIELQKEFLEKGLTYMKPMNIADVATALDLHESTVSRITTGKYIATPRGVFELKYFFPSQISTTTGSCSNIAVMEHIKQIIQHEEDKKPFSDTDIVNLLKEKGIKVARRTVAKYRETMKILPAYQRARIKTAKSL